MTSEGIYQQTLIDLSKAGHARGRLARPDATAVIHNPLCGDRVTIDVCATAAEVTAFAQQVRGCALCEAAAAWLGLNATGRTQQELREATYALDNMLRGERFSLTSVFDELRMFAPVAEHKSRHRCVSLPFEALIHALDDVVCRN